MIINCDFNMAALKSVFRIAETDTETTAVKCSTKYDQKTRCFFWVALETRGAHIQLL